MARYIVLDGDGVWVEPRPFISFGAALTLTKRRLHEETLFTRKPHVFLTEDHKAALIGFVQGVVFEPHYFIQEYPNDPT